MVLSAPGPAVKKQKSMPNFEFEGGMRKIGSELGGAVIAPVLSVAPVAPVAACAGANYPCC